jgi:site-specific DNA recombinase
LEQSFNSLHAQREACEAYIRSQAGEGWSMIKTAYDDGGYSGGTMQRPALQQLLADIQRGLVDIIVVYKVDRLTRSLADFAKMVEQFEARKVSFVSVTQAFNTTSSMGRLTLNVLLSFAQFEREVTGERIRDKVAASKAKGLRMGGRPPLGYDIKDGRLIVNEAEAERVRDIFRRYLQLGTISRLADDGVLSKRWINRAGDAAGGTMMSRGAIRELLRNDTYLGMTRHKEKRYPNTHPAIVDQALFDEVQEKLSSAPASAPSTPRATEVAQLANKIFDDRGHPMDPVQTARRGRLYRYYVSRPHLRGSSEEAGSLRRVSTGMIERFLRECLEPMLVAGWRPDDEPGRRVTRAVRRLVIGADQLVVLAEPEALKPGAPAELDSASGASRLRFEFHMRKRQGALVVAPKGHDLTSDAQPDRALIRAVVLARDWAAKLENGEIASARDIARQEGLCNHYLGRLLPLAYLAPDIVATILEGRQPHSITLSALTSAPLPLAWDEQRRLVAAL